MKPQSPIIVHADRSTIAHAIKEAHKQWRTESANTMRHRAEVVAQALDVRLTAELSAGELFKAYALLEKSGLKPTSIRIYVAAFKAALRRGGVKFDDWPNTPSIPRLKPREPISLADIARVHAYCLTRNWDGTASLIHVLLHTGMRVHREALLGNWAVRGMLPNVQLRINGKGGHERLVPVVDRECAAILKSQSDPLFGTPSYHEHCKRFAHAVQACEVDTRLPTFHAIRHRYATDCLSRCQNLEVVRQMMGHSSILTTARYIGVDLDAMRAALDPVETEMEHLTQPLEGEEDDE